LGEAYVNTSLMKKVLHITERKREHQRTAASLQVG
jgi:hypothetical protein